jgi:enoyl-CoA hydratase/carnithine racemase
MSTLPLVTSRTEGAVALVAFARPEKRNAISRDVLRALVDAMTAAERDRTVRAIVLYGEGRVFSAGVDFTMLAEDVAAGHDRTPFRSQIGDMQAIGRLETIEKPVIAAMHRYVPGLALEVALACDFRIATQDCELGLPEVKLGLVPDVGGTTRLVRTVGRAKAKELILTGRMIPASEALQMGLLTEIAPDGTHVEAAIRLAEEIAQNAPLAAGSRAPHDLGADTDAHTFQAMSPGAERAPQDRRRRGRPCRRAASAALHRPVIERSVPATPT